MKPQGLRVLIADDEPLHIAALSAHLSALGHTVVARATNGEEAITLAAEHKPDLIIMNNHMLGISGPEAAERIVKHRPTPIIMLSAYGDRLAIEAAATAPINGYLLMPVGPDELMPTIAVALARFQEAQAREKRLSEAEARLEARGIIERAKGLIMRHKGLDEDSAYKLLRTESQKRSIPMRVLAEGIVLATATLPHDKATVSCWDPASGSTRRRKQDTSDTRHRAR